MEEVMSKKVLVATIKPFAKAAVEQIKMVFSEAGYELVLLESYKEQSEFVEAVKDVDALIIRSDKCTAEVLNNAKNLKIVVRAGAGYDNIDLQVATENGVVAMNTPGQNSNAVAELVFGLMITLARKQYLGKAGTELRHKRIGIHAYGNVGKFAAKIAQGFQMEVYAFDPYVDDAIMKADEVQPVNSVEELYSSCDYISLHLPKIKETINSVNYELMSQMKKGAAIINTARKEVVDEEGLKRIFAARDDFLFASDVAPDCKDELREKYPERCFFTAKKMGAQTLEANINAGVAAATQIINFFEKGDITFKVN